MVGSWNLLGIQDYDTNYSPHKWELCPGAEDIEAQEAFRFFKSCKFLKGSFHYAFGSLKRKYKHVCVIKIPLLLTYALERILFYVTFCIVLHVNTMESFNYM